MSQSKTIKYTHPESLKFLVNKKEAEKYSYGSNKYIQCQCPSCGFIKKMMVSNLIRRGFSCPICKDGVSYPEKFIMNLLRVQNISFIYQFNKKNCDWCNQYRYDFYLTDYNMIIEVNGMQHYTDSFGKTKEHTQKNDKNKKQLALLNNIKEQNYIVLDCSFSKKEWIIKAIKQSNLSNIMSFENTDFEQIDKQSHYSLLPQICKFYELHKDWSTQEIANHFNLSSTTIIRYLNIGYKHHLCSYNSKEERIKASKKGNKVTQEKLSKSTEVYKEGVLICTYPSARELIRKSLQDFGIQFNYTCVCDVCRGLQKTHYGYVFKYKT